MGWTFPLKEALLWTHIWTEEMVLNLNVLMDLFNTNMQLFTSWDVN